MFYVTCNMEKRKPDTPKENKTKELVCEVSGLMTLKKKICILIICISFVEYISITKRWQKHLFFLSFSLN